MEHSAHNFAELLQQYDIRPTYPRIKVLEYLTIRKTHPTADEIYHALIDEIPSLSKMTVYNTLKLLADKHLIAVVNIEENEMRYDGIRTRHGHFKCKVCGTIYDFPVDIEDVGVEGLDGFRITERNVLFQGVCRQCLDREREKR